MTDITIVADKPHPLIPDTHWRIEQIQVINWGGFHQKTATFEFHPDATIVTGASGVGKSTILDAYLALMMPSDVAFNGASNAAAGGRVRGSDQRSLHTYLKGKTDDTVEDGITVDKSLRGQGKPTWGAVAADVRSRHREPVHGHPCLLRAVGGGARRGHSETDDDDTRRLRCG